MQIDWITVAAQVVNFLVLVWLLQRFLYGPIIRAMDRREQRVAAQMQGAEKRKQEAQKELRAYREQLAQLEQQRERLLTEAREAAEMEQRSLESALREDMLRHRRDWLKQLRDQEQNFLRELRQRSIEHFYALARQALGDLANTQLEGQMAKVFVQRLEQLDRIAQQKLARECRGAGNRVTLRTRFELSPAERRLITKAIHEHISDGADVAYEETEQIGCGMELKAGSQTVLWSLDGYFDSLEKAVGHEIVGTTALSASGAAR